MSLDKRSARRSVGERRKTDSIGTTHRSVVPISRRGRLDTPVPIGSNADMTRLSPGDRIRYTPAFCTSICADARTRNRAGVYIDIHPTLGKRFALVRWDDADEDSAVNTANIRRARTRGARSGGRTAAIEAFRALAREAGQIHGSEMRDLFAEHGVPGGIWCLDETEIGRMVDGGELEALAYAPTHDQAAFDSLSYSTAYLRELGRKAPTGGPTPGLRTRYLYRWRG